MLSLRDWMPAPVLRVGLIAGVMIAVIDILFVAWNWPFTRRRQLESLEHFSQSEVTIGHFDKKFFPQPGFDAARIAFVRRRDRSPITLARVERLQCRSTWLNLLTDTHRVTELHLSGVAVTISERVPPAMPMFPNRKERATVERLSADGASVTVGATRLAFPHLRLFNVGKGKVLTYDLAARIPKPDAYVTSQGKIGPFSVGNKRVLPLSGRFKVRDGNLHSFDTLDGTLSADGKFFGSLGHLNIAGVAVVQRFHLLSAPNPVDISSNFQISADCTHGLIDIRKAHVRFGHSEVEAVGSVAKQVLSVTLNSQEARLEDLLQLVVSAPQPPATGGIEFHSEVVLPPGTETFLRRIRMNGTFQIDGGEFNNPKNQYEMNALSARANNSKKGLDLKRPPRIRALLRAVYHASAGIATFSAITFEVPNASARATGTFDMLAKVIDFRGILGMRASLSSAAGGIKSMFLLPLDPIYKKDGFGALVVIAVEGTYGHPVFKASLRQHGQKAKMLDRSR